MTPSQAKRAAFLIVAKESIQYEIAPNEGEARGTGQSLSRLPPAKKIELQRVNDNDDIHTLAKIDAGLAVKAFRYLICEIDAELKELGVTE